MSEYANDYERLGQHPLMRDTLIAATLDDPNRALDPAIRSLLLYDPSDPRMYNLQEEIEKPIRAVAFEGTTKSTIEWYMDVSVTPARKLLLPKAPRPAGEGGGMTETPVVLRQAR